MTKEQAITNFWKRIYPRAYDANTVPKDLTFPYITFSVPTDSVGNVLYGSVSIWDNSYSWSIVDKIKDDIAQAIKNQSPPTIKIDGGRLYITKGVPFSQRVADSVDTIRHVEVNVNYEFLTDN